MQFEDIIRNSQKELKHKLAKHLKRTGYKVQQSDGYLYAKGDIPVLLVAHLDTVHKEKVKFICYSKDNKVMSPQGIGGDDRCGVYMILEIIKELRCHVLFCEDEEIGAIGASKFCKSKIKPDVNYIIEIDREGSNDAVFYDCYNLEFIEFITDFGFTEEWGSFSDISIIAPHLGIAAVNISSGFYYSHRLHEYIDLNVVKRNIERIKDIIKNSDSTFYKYVEPKYNKLLCKSYLYDDYITNIFLMELHDSDGFIMFDDGEVREAGGYFMDLENIVYYEEATGECLELNNALPLTPEGDVIEFDEGRAKYMEVMYW